jgi:hypothetical protein
MYVGIDPADPADLISLSGGRTLLSDGLAERVRVRLNRYRLAGIDLEIRPAQYVPLEVEVTLCVCPQHFRTVVAHAVRTALVGDSAKRRARAFFSPDRFTFGESVYLSRLYAAIESVPGVDSARVTMLKRNGKPAAGELDSGVLSIGPLEVARLDADANRLEYGVLRLTAKGGK